MYNYSRPRSTRDFEDESEESFTDEYDEEIEYRVARRRDHYRRNGGKNLDRINRPDPNVQMMGKS